MSRTPRPTRSPLVRVLSPLRDFIATEAAGAALLAGAAAVALIWANSPWSASYENLWTSRAGISIGGHELNMDIRHWVNEGLMTIFFLVVGLEIKRELTDGHLASRRAALLPGAAALGGMLIPAVLYLAIAGSTAPRGWAIPVATDIALAVGVLAVVGNRIPPSLRAFLLGLAIVDDIGAIVIIAAVYSGGVNVYWLAAAVLAVGAAFTVRRVGIYSTQAFVVIGSMVWLCLHNAGVHATIAGVAMGVLAPSVPRFQPELIDSDELTDLSDAEAARTTSDLARGSVSVVEWLLHVLHPWTSYAVVPIFALANSGIVISSADLVESAQSPITWGVFVGLLLGKPLGVVVATRACIRGGLADLPEGSTGTQIVGVGAAAGIGFTVALFITELALADPSDQSHAKLAILMASLFAASLSCLILMRRRQTVS